MARSRIHEIDFVRGVALLGILVVNMPYHGLPADIAAGVPAIGDHAALAAWGIVGALFESKFYALFSLMFGMSLALQRESLLARRGRWMAAILRRHVFLLCVGLLHGVALFYLDVLFPYAVLGTVALIGFRLPARVTLWAGIGLLVVGTFCAVRGEVSEAISVTRAPAAVAPLQGPVTLDNLMPSDMQSLTAIELRVFREGPMWAAFVVRGMEYGFWLYMSTLFTDFNARILALMLIGIVFIRANVLGERWVRARRRTLVSGWLIGLCLEIGSTVLVAIDPDRQTASRVAIAVVQSIGSLALAAAYAATLVAWAQSPFLASLRAPIAAAGRMAFTNYLGQSIVANVVFSGLGLAWYGELDRTALFGLAILVYAAQVMASAWWLTRFEMGPLEWVWRVVTHLQSPPLRRGRAVILAEP